MSESKRRSGVLMSISSLPSPYGIGVFGDEAVAFARRIAEMGFSCWQVLPFTPLDYAASPYGSDSAFAGNELYISPQLMANENYVTQAEADECIYPGSPYTADYAFASRSRAKLLKTAYSRLNESEKAGIDRFVADRSLLSYCLYRALKEKNSNRPFWEWGEESRFSAALSLADGLAERIRFFGFAQYLFASQWASTKQKINALGIKLIGDMPIYVSRDSADVFAHPELFLLDRESFAPSLVAGVPPDYFSEDGQLWGNPLYDWDANEKQGYSWWIDRIKHSFTLYDELRIDHFRAFASFWAVDGNAKTAREGKWMPGPGMKLFSAVRESLGSKPIIAEDLGVFSEDVALLLEDSGFPGMRIIQFAFAVGDDSTHLPHNYIKNCVAYVGTHDNNTLLGWLWELTPPEREFALRYCAFEGGDWSAGGYRAPACRRIIEAVWRSSADTVIIPFQDMCGFGSDARMNRPGLGRGNWLFRTTDETVGNMDGDYFRGINKLFRR